MKSIEKSKIAQITYYEPQSAGINLQSPQSESTPRRLTLVVVENVVVVVIARAFLTRCRQHLQRELISAYIGMY